MVRDGIDKLFSGSPFPLEGETLQPRDGFDNKNDPIKAVFATPDRQQAAAYMLGGFSVSTLTGPDGSPGNTETAQRTSLVLVHDTPPTIMEKPITGRLHTLGVDGFSPVLGADGEAVAEYVSQDPVQPTETEAFQSAREIMEKTGVQVFALAPGTSPEQFQQTFTQSGQGRDGYAALVGSGQAVWLNHAYDANPSADYADHLAEAGIDLNDLPKFDIERGAELDMPKAAASNLGAWREQKAPMVLAEKQARAPATPPRQGLLRKIAP